MTALKSRATAASEFNGSPPASHTGPGPAPRQAADSNAQVGPQLDIFTAACIPTRGCFSRCQPSEEKGHRAHHIASWIA